MNLFGFYLKNHKVHDAQDNCALKPIWELCANKAVLMLFYFHLFFGIDLQGIPHYVGSNQEKRD